MRFDYDLIVIGAGHAGCEAAHAAARLGVSTLLMTIDMNKIAQMSCNPAVGGIAKGQIVREIDALGGMIGVVTDESAIQFRMLNRSKGPAMWSPRAQSDRMEFSRLWRNRDYHYSVVKELEARGWSFESVLFGIENYRSPIKITLSEINPLYHCEKYQLINQCFAGKQRLMPFFHRSNNKDLIHAVNERRFS